jgi:chromosome segregation ATPase
MNLETLLWVGGLVIEALLLAAVVLAMLLRRSRKQRQQLLKQLGAEAPSTGEAAAAAEFATAVVESIEGSKGAADRSTVAIEPDATALAESTERLQHRVDLTNESLQRLELDLQQDGNADIAAHPEIATLKDNLQEMTSEIGSLHESSVKLRHDMTALRDRLRDSEIDVQKLQTEKEALAAEYASLSQEYERIYANSPKA